MLFLEIIAPFAAAALLVTLVMVFTRRARDPAASRLLSFGAVLVVGGVAMLIWKPGVVPAITLVLGVGQLAMYRERRRALAGHHAPEA